MKIKIIACALLFIGISSNSFAIEIKNGKILKHREWQTGSAIGKFVDIQKPSLLNHMDHFARQNNLSSQMDFAGIFTDLDHMTAKAGEKVSIQGQSNTSLSNFTSYPQIYKVLTVLCTSTSPEYFSNCISAEDTIQLDPKAELKLLRYPILYATYDKPGVYYNYIYTGVTIERQDNQPTTIAYSGTNKKLVIKSE